MPTAPDAILPTGLPAAPTAPVAVQAAGVPAALTITGTLTSNGSIPVLFALLYYYDHEQIDGQLYPRYGLIEDETEYVTPTTDGLEHTGWKLTGYGASWQSSETVASPELCAAWVPVAAATGTPVITASGFTPGMPSAPAAVQATGMPSAPTAPVKVQP